MTGRLPLAVGATSIALFGTGAWFERSGPDVIAMVVIGLWLTTLTIVAGVVAAKQPRNPVGWLLLGAAFTISLNLFLSGYAEYALETRPGSLPFAVAAAWGTLWTSVPAGVLFVIALLLFPNGRLLSPRWKAAVWIAVAAGLVMIAGLAAKPGPIDTVPSVDNPVRFPGGAILYELADDVASTALTLVVLATIGSLIMRMRRSRGAERQQLKWFVYSVALFPVLFAAGAAADVVLDAQLGTDDHYVDFLLMMLGALLIPVSMGISILRYRLYDIDVIVNRTLVYGSLTAILATAYLAAVVLLQRLLGTFTRDSDLAVAASTLAVAALFRPVRSRVQTFIDRRFYRRKYDAAETLDAFSAHLRDEVDLDSLKGEIVGVVRRTMQPTHVSLWVRQEAVQ